MSPQLAAHCRWAVEVLSALTVAAVLASRGSQAHEPCSGKDLTCGRPLRAAKSWAEALMSPARAMAKQARRPNMVAESGTVMLCTCSLQ